MVPDLLKRGDNAVAPRSKSDAGGFQWAGGAAPQSSFSRDFLSGPVLQVARDLLGCRLVSTVGGRRTAGVIVEVEAYEGPEDPASHAATKTGITPRNAVMFGPAGRAYVYRIYGVHWCFNVVSGAEGIARAVLIRGLSPLEGEDVMGERRHHRLPLCAGPGRLGEALGITGALYGHRLDKPPLQLLPGWSVLESTVAVSGRIGVRAAADWPYRFYVRNAEGVSRR